MDEEKAKPEGGGGETLPKDAVPGEPSGDTGATPGEPQEKGRGGPGSNNRNLVIGLLVAIAVLAAVSVALTAVLLARGPEKPAPVREPLRLRERLPEMREGLKELRKGLEDIGEEFGIRRIAGRVAGLDGDLLTVKTDGEEVKVKLTESTRYGSIGLPRWRFEKERPEIKAGDPVVVLARESDGTLEAVVVRLTRKPNRCEGCEH